MLIFIHPGTYTSLQDLGRWNSHAFGVPLSGAMDRNSAMLANVLLDNPVETPVLEFTLVGPQIQWKQSGTAAWTGGYFEVKSNIQGAVSRDIPIPFESNEIWTFGSVKRGLRGYLAVKGGFDESKVFGSCAMSPGVTERVVFGKNDQLLFAKNTAPVSPTYSHLKNTPLEVKRIFGYKGPEWHLWEQSIGENLNIEWMVSKDHNRMGVRLLPLSPTHQYSMTTSPILPGTIQWTPSGQLILIMRDGQTTGGYPRIIQLTEESINCLAQKNTYEKFYIELIEWNF